MQKIVITGGNKLKGAVRVSGSKNAALPILASSLLVAGKSQYRNVPQVDDVRTLLGLLSTLGANVQTSGHRVCVEGAGVTRLEATYDHVMAMRASFLVLGPLVARYGEAKVSMPGGCAIGARPIDQHLKGLQALGAKIELENGMVVAKAKRLRGAMFVFDRVTVTGTENVMMAAALAKGHTTLENAAREPEVEELACVLNKMGARIAGAGTATINVEGVPELFPVDHAIIPDRIEAGTYLLAGALTRGNVLVQDCVPEHLAAFMAKLRAAGADLTVEPEGVRVRGFGSVEPTDVVTRAYPGFPSDLQAPFMALMTRARGQSVLSESVFENRFLHVPELQRMGADIAVEGHTAVVRGPAKLKGVRVMATDLRAAAALVLAGLVAQGSTEIYGVNHLDRGYEAIEKNLRALGADVRRAKAKDSHANEAK
jgi:UDP-N-acetylglucosamine 1-carboxyvinyltransferase